MRRALGRGRRPAARLRRRGGAPTAVLGQERPDKGGSPLATGRDRVD
jgi:hypothetical protein